MAEPQDVPKPNQEQEAILQRAPYLKAFMDQTPDLGGSWLDQLEPLGESLEKELTKRVGSNWFTTTLGPLTLMTEEQKVFDTGLTKTERHSAQDQLFRVVKSLFLIGYEIGNQADALKASVPIAEKLSKHGLFHTPELEEKEPYSQRVFNTLWGIIQSGVFIRFYNDQESKPSGTSPQTDPFEDFIQGLESIDKLPPKGVGS